MIKNEFFCVACKNSYNLKIIDLIILSVDASLKFTQQFIARADIAINMRNGSQKNDIS